MMPIGGGRPATELATRPQDADTGKKNCPQSRRVTPDHAYRTKIHIYVSLAKVESNISCSNTEIWVQFKNIDNILQSWLLKNLPLRSLPKGDEKPKPILQI
jgi:hypothetical protein